MPTYESSITIDVPADRLFAYLADVENLPTYLPRITSARSTGDGTVDVTASIEHDGETREVEGEAWVRAEEPGTTLTWGAPGPNSYTGQIDLDPVDETSCRATVRIDTERQGERVQEGVDEAAEGIKRAAEAHHA